MHMDQLVGVLPVLAGEECGRLHEKFAQSVEIIQLALLVANPFLDPVDVDAANHIEFGLPLSLREITSTSSPRFARASA